jgi:hypothetical protein
MYNELPFQMTSINLASLGTLVLAIGPARCAGTCPASRRYKARHAIASGAGRQLSRHREPPLARYDSSIGFAIVS